MSVGTKLLGLMLLAALLPLAIALSTALRIHQRAFDGKLTEIHRMAAENGAATARNAIEAARAQLGALARTIPWADLSADERAGALRLLYGQLDDIVAVSVVDRAGQGLGSSAYQTDDAGVHPPVTAQDLDMFGRAIPLEPALAAGFAVAGPIWLAEAPAPIVTLAYRIRLPDGDGVVAVGLSLRGLCRSVAAAPAADRWTSIRARDGRTICPGAGPPSGIALISASAEGPLEWQIVSDAPRAAAFAPSNRIRRQTFTWVLVAVAAALVAGLVLSRGIRRPLAQLTAGAEAIAAGRLDHKVPVSGRDELSKLAVTFNRMGDEIARQDAEIRTWNEELRQRVEARTRDLVAAQEALVEARKLAGLATLGAGIAHEVNNPLSGVLGLTQVLLAKAPEGSREHRALTSIEREAQRIRDIVHRMSALAAEAPQRATVPMRSLLDAVAASLSGRLAAAKVELVREDDAELTSVLGDAAQLEQALREIADNGIRAMQPGGGVLTIRARNEARTIVVDVIDGGRGIAPEVLDRIFEPFYTTKQDWRSHGLGLAVAQRIVAAHGGTIRVVSESAKGTTMTITLPRTSVETHLA